MHFNEHSHDGEPIKSSGFDITIIENNRLPLLTSVILLSISCLLYRTHLAHGVLGNEPITNSCCGANPQLTLTMKAKSRSYEGAAACDLKT